MTPIAEHVSWYFSLADVPSIFRMRDSLSTSVLSVCYAVQTNASLSSLAPSILGVNIQQDTWVVSGGWIRSPVARLFPSLLRVIAVAAIC